MATLEQAVKVLEIFKGVPTEQVQAIISSGALADLRDANFSEINRDEFRNELRRLCGLKSFVSTITLTISLSRAAKLFVYDKTKDGWKLISDVEFQSGEVELDFCEFLKPGESSVKGIVMAERAKELNAKLGQKHAEWLLEHQDLIPKEWRGFYISFPATVWRDQCGYRHVPYLGWDGGQWSLHFRWLVHDWYSSDRLLRFSK